jgi:hypothetical protein
MAANNNLTPGRMDPGNTVMVWDGSDGRTPHVEITAMVDEASHDSDVDALWATTRYSVELGRDTWHATTWRGLTQTQASRVLAAAHALRVAVTAALADD